MSDTFIDHESLTLERFLCPKCKGALELVELRTPGEDRANDPDGVELVAVCRRCEIGLSAEAWAQRRDA
jgi:hypothetical protein